MGDEMIKYRVFVTEFLDGEEIGWHTFIEQGESMPEHEEWYSCEDGTRARLTFSLLRGE